MTAQDRPRQTALQHTHDETDHQADHDSRHDRGHDSGCDDQPGRVARVPGSVPREAGRAHRAVGWVGWHLGELVGVGVPTVLAVTVHPLWTVPAVVVAAGWVANERRLARRKTSARADADRAGCEGTGREEWRA